MEAGHKIHIGVITLLHRIHEPHNVHAAPVDSWARCWKIYFNVKLKGENIALEPYGRGLFLVRAVCWIVGGFDFGETPHAGSVDLGDSVLERLALDIFLDLPVLDLPLQADELPLQGKRSEFPS